MTLYDYIKTNCKDGWFDEDTYDTVFDYGITVCVDIDSTSDEYYQKFCTGLLKHVEVDTMDGDCVLKWSDMIKDNIELFRNFANWHWNISAEEFEDDDDLIYEWLKELHYWLAGYTSENVYKTFCEEVIEARKGVQA